MFAFGSGCASTFWTIRVKGDISEIAKKMDLLKRLESMEVVSCDEYTKGLQVCSLLSFLHVFAVRLLSSGVGLCSSGRRTITRRHISPRATSRTSGRALTTSTASTACSGGSTSRLKLPPFLLCSLPSPPFLLHPFRPVLASGSSCGVDFHHPPCFLFYSFVSSLVLVTRSRSRFRCSV